MVLPSLIIISLIAAVLTNFSELEAVQHALAGIRVAVVVLVGFSVKKLMAAGVQKGLGWALFVLTFFASALFGISPVAVVLVAAAAGDPFGALGTEEGEGMNLLLLCLEFFKTGLLSVGGGLATLPFLYEMADKYPWFTRSQLSDMIAVSESTPGPMGSIWQPTRAIPLRGYPERFWPRCRWCCPAFWWC